MAKIQVEMNHNELRSLEGALKHQLKSLRDLSPKDKRRSWIPNREREELASAMGEWERGILKMLEKIRAWKALAVDAEISELEDMVARGYMSKETLQERIEQIRSLDKPVK